MQIVNIVRDVGEDQVRGRRYLPLELLERHHYSERDFSLGMVDERFHQVIRELDTLARSWFTKGLRGLETYPVSSAFSVELAASFYAAILDEVKTANYEVYKKRVIVSSIHKLKLYTSIKMKYTLQSEFNEITVASI